MLALLWRWWQQLYKATNLNMGVWGGCLFQQKAACNICLLVVMIQCFQNMQMIFLWRPLFRFTVSAAHADPPLYSVFKSGKLGNTLPFLSTRLLLWYIYISDVWITCLYTGRQFGPGAGLSALTGTEQLPMKYERKSNVMAAWLKKLKGYNFKPQWNLCCFKFWYCDWNCARTSTLTHSLTRGEQRILFTRIRHLVNLHRDAHIPIATLHQPLQ